MSNRLATSQSLYLRKHAENPIDWWDWCEEALEKAKVEDKPILLSIGYSSCHWCTVMEGEAFSDLAVAEYMNANFLPIKVDREERPDLDSIYMQALQMMTGQGGWPLNIFLTPDDLVPFYGGTYFPLQPRYGRAGFLQVLQALRSYYDTEKEDLRDRTSTIFEAIKQSAVLPGTVPLDNELLRQGFETNTGVITGGDVGTKFPMIPNADLALRGVRFSAWLEEFRYNPKETCIQRGLDLSLGGIYDHVGGGFHRYTVDPTWTVPHFEKMLYDNGQIVEYLASLWSAGEKEPAFKRAIALTVQWLKREMTAPEGYFYAAQDADSFITGDEAEPEEGAFYVWSYSELEQLLTTDELALLQNQFTVTPNGNFEGKNVLQRRPGILSDALEIALEKLFAIRYGAKSEEIKTFPPARNNQEAKTYNWSGRIPPVTDTKMIVAWNSLMISGLVRAYSVFKQDDYLHLATKAANFILDHQWVDGRFHRLNYEGKAAVRAQSEDYALFIKALLDLDQALQARGENELSKSDDSEAAIASQKTAKFFNGAESLGCGFAVLENNAGGEATPHFFRSPKAFQEEVIKHSDSQWLEKAIAVQAEFDEFLWSVELGGYYNTAKDGSQELIVRERSYADNATPAANGVAIANLVRLALLTEDLSYLDRAEQALQAFSSVMKSYPQACPSLFTALDWYRHCTLVRTSSEQLDSLITQYLPASVLKIETQLPQRALGLVCQGLSCLSPAQSLDQLQEQIQQSQIRSL